MCRFGYITSFIFVNESSMFNVRLSLYYFIVDAFFIKNINEPSIFKYSFCSKKRKRRKDLTLNIKVRATGSDRH